MKLSRYVDYFSQLRRHLGFKAAGIFTLAHLRNKLAPPRTGLAHIPVGPYTF